MTRPLRILIAILLFSASVHTQSGQRTYQDNGISATNRPPTIQKMVADTIFPAILSDTCAGRVYAYGVAAPDEGFFMGSNTYGDQQKLQRLRVDADGPFLITGVMAAFVEYDISAADREIRAIIYPELTTDSILLAPIAISEPIRVNEILLPDDAVNYTMFEFTEPVVVDASSFFVSIDFSDTYNSNPLGFVGLFHTRDGCGDGTNVLEIFETTTGDLFYGVVPDRWQGANVELLVAAVIDTDTTTSVYQPLADYSSSVVPNPTRGHLTINYNSSGNQPFTATLTDLTGRTLFIQRSTTISGRNTFDWDVSTLPTGLYLYHLDGPAGRQSGKVVKR